MFCGKGTWAAAAVTINGKVSSSLKGDLWKQDFAYFSFQLDTGQLIILHIIKCLKQLKYSQA